MRIIFFGTSEFGCPTLEILFKHYEIPFVITAKIKGKEEKASPIKKFSDHLGVKAYTLGNPNNETHAADLTRRLARILDGQAVLMPAPGIAGSRNTQVAFQSDPYVIQALELGVRADLAVFGIGAPRKDSILIQQGNIITWPELAALADRGAVGDINLRYFDSNGQPVASELDDRVVGLTIGDIRRIKHVVGIAGGSAKFEAIKAALEGKLVDVLVTDHILAQSLLENSLPA